MSIISTEFIVCMSFLHWEAELLISTKKKKEAILKFLYPSPLIDLKTRTESLNSMFYWESIESLEYTGCYLQTICWMSEPLRIALIVSFLMINV